MVMAKKQLCEDILGEFRVVWSYDHYHAEVFVYEKSEGQILNRGKGQSWRPIVLFPRLGSTESNDETENINDAACRCSFYVRWDGSIHSQQGDDEGYSYISGPHDVAVHMRLSKYIWDRAYQLMGRGIEEGFEPIPLEITTHLDSLKSPPIPVPIPEIVGVWHP